MQKIKRILAGALMLATIISCSRSFLEPNPQADLTYPDVNSQDGVEALLVGAYGLLNGNVEGLWVSFASAPSQWLFGDVAADNAHKGSSGGDQPNMNFIEQNTPTSTNDNLGVIWNRCYEGILRCNNTLRVLAQVQSEGTDAFDEERAIQIEGEARLLRAHYYFFIQRLFINIPWVPEDITSTDERVTIPNNEDVRPMIEADLRFAVENLTNEKYQSQVGRLNLPVAQAYLGKFLLYQDRYEEALPFLDAVITAKGSLVNMDFTENYDIRRENGAESVFEVQHGLNADGSGDNANTGDMLNFFYGNAPINCCGFLQPSIDLVNAYKVDANGLPLLDNSYRDDPYLSDLDLTDQQKPGYELDRSIHFDPRLDYTVGRRGVPFRDWGVMPGDAWIRDPGYGGPFVGIKHTIEQSLFAGNTVAGTVQVTGLNVKIIRLADVYLMAAECNVELGNLPRALELVNAVRTRAASLAPKTVGGSPVAVYDVKPYPAFPSADYARNAVRFERRLELALEGHRFFDLVRWGIAKQVLDSYSQFEGEYLSVSRGLSFQPQAEYYPIPQVELDRSGGALTQNPGY